MTQDREMKQELMTIEKAREIVELHKHFESMIKNPFSDVTQVLIPYAEAKGFINAYESQWETIRELVNIVKEVVNDIPRINKKEFYSKTIAKAEKFL